MPRERFENRTERDASSDQSAFYVTSKELEQCRLFDSIVDVKAYSDIWWSLKSLAARVVDAADEHVIPVRRK